MANSNSKVAVGTEAEAANARAEVRPVPHLVPNDAPVYVDDSLRANEPVDQKDHFMERDGVVFAGSHLIVDLWDAAHLDDIKHIEQALRDAVDAAGATLLHIHLHHFEPNGGVSGVAVLAESHISIHTWPEKDYAALDIFMCGDAVPMHAVPVLKRAFGPCRVQLSEMKRGVIA